MNSEYDPHSEVIQTYQQLLEVGYIRDTVDHSYGEQPLFGCSISVVESDPVTSIRTPEIARQISSGYYSFVVLTQGSGYWVSRHGERYLKPGSILFIRAREAFTFHFTERYQAVSFNVPAELLEHHLGQLPQHGLQLTDNTGGYVQLLQRVLSAQPMSLSAAERLRLERMLLAELQPQLLASERQARSSLGDVALMIRQHSMEEGFSIDWLAEHCNASRRYLFKLFEQQPLSLNQYIQKSQLGQAFNLLTDGNKAHLQVGDIAFQSGFKTQAHFSRLFKQRYQVTPKRLREVFAETPSSF